MYTKKRFINQKMLADLVLIAYICDTNISKQKTYL